MNAGGLFGREAEQERIDGLLADAEAARSATLVLVGEPGIGKSRLLGYAEAQGSAMQILRAQGVEAESELAFGGLLELIRPILDLLPSLPTPQAEALAGALALSNPTATDRFTVYAGVLSLLAAAAEGRPVLALVDDAHWLDRASQEALIFAARRLHADRVALVLAVREGHAEPFTLGGLTAVRLSGLAQEAATALLTQSRGTAFPPTVVDQLLKVTSGNPLALKEASLVLSAEQIRGVEPLDHPMRIGNDLTRAFTRRLSALPAAVGDALLLAAASETGEMSEITAASAALDIDIAGFGVAEDAGLVTIDAGRLRFVHPLLRSAVYHDATAQRRRTAHAALGRVLSAPADAYRRAWHLAAASLGPDESVAAELEAAARDASVRGAPAVAASTYERAARLSPVSEDRARRMFAAAAEMRLAGPDAHMLALLEEALPLADDPELRGEIQALRGLIIIWIRPGDEARNILIDEASRVEQADPGRAATLLAYASGSYTVTGRLDVAAELMERAYGLAPRNAGPASDMAATYFGGGLVILGEAERARPLLAQGRDLVERIDERQLIEMDIGHWYVWAEDYRTASRFFDRKIDLARAGGAPGPLPFPLSARSDLDFRTGNWNRAYADASEAVHLADHMTAPVHLSYSLACVARVEAGRGREMECRRHAESALAIADSLGLASVRNYAHAAMGLLELGLGRPEVAITELERARETGRLHGVSEPTVIQFEADLIEAYVRSGRTSDARDALERFEERAHATGRIWSRATSARCRGLLAPEHGYEEDFYRALLLNDRLPMPFERARTELCLGERRRRSGRRSDAVAVLRSAAATFDQLGAAPWADHARRELKACGVSRQPRSSAMASLTPQELQVALVVSGGATNREAGTSLFLSPKTVEFHLGHVYGKLGLRSRAELARFVAVGGLASDSTTPQVHRLD